MSEYRINQFADTLAKTMIGAGAERGVDGIADVWSRNIETVSDELMTLIVRDTIMSLAVFGSDCLVTFRSLGVDVDELIAFDLAEADLRSQRYAPGELPVDLPDTRPPAARDGEDT